MKFLITGGGTGGHIYPALAIAGEIKETYKDAEILYIGTQTGLEAELVPKAGFEFKTIRVKGLPRRLNKKSFIALKELFLGINDSKKIIKEFNPNIVIGTGGYVSGPICYTSSKMKIPTLVHEQNAFPGITNKILSRYADRVLVNFDEAKQYFKYPERVVNVGNPIRNEIMNIDKEHAYKKLNIKKDIPFILSFGGSGGQKSLNDAIFYIIKNYKKEDNFQLLHITGNKNYENFINNLAKENISINKNIKIMPYFYDMPDAMNIADLVITSSGAITLAEISAIGIPSVLIPKAYTAENHQEYNAQVFEKNNAAKMILEKDLNADYLYTTLKSLLDNKEKLKEMSVNSKKLSKTDSAKLIINEVGRLINKK